MAISYKLRMYRREVWTRRLRLAGILFGSLALTAIIIRGIGTLI